MQIKSNSSKHSKYTGSFRIVEPLFANIQTLVKSEKPGLLWAGGKRLLGDWCNIPRHQRRFCRLSLGVLIIGLVLIVSAGIGICEGVDQATARRVAENALHGHIALHGDWNGTTTPAVAHGEAVSHQGIVVAYNFAVRPTGHVLVAVDDALSPVLLYSARSSFDAQRVNRKEAIENWIIPEIHHQVNAVNAYRASGAGFARSAALSTDARRIAAAWAAYATGDLSDLQEDTQSRSLIGDNESEFERTLAAGATVGPLLTTAWGQFSPYNLMTPDDGCVSGHTLTGCVATAWAQLLRYWAWPIQGTGAGSYTWWSQTLTPLDQTLSANFEVNYGWDLMPDVLSQESSDLEKEAVSQLMYHMGVAAQMDYGCDGSGSNVYADEVLGEKFKYKQDTLLQVNRTSTSHSGEEWFALIRAELDADPPRPVVFSIYDASGGHEVIIDGYQTSPTDMVHINFGWEGYEDGYYNISFNFEAGDSWWVANSQDIVIGIEPDNARPVVEAGGLQVVEEAALVQLSGSAVDPEGVGIRGYAWRQISGPAVTLSAPDATDPAFTAPDVHAETDLAFQLRADDANRAFATDTCTVTVRNTDGSTAPDPPATHLDSSGGGGGGGGCFVSSLSPFDILP
jgi:hypothetical protein